jgi:hypothetical protein
MKRIKIILLLVLAVLFISSCKKEIIGENASFIGVWYGDYTRLEINQDGSGKYDYSNGFLTKNIYGKVKFKTDIIKFKTSVFSKKYTITQRPITEFNDTYMILDGEEFYKE